MYRERDIYTHTHTKKYKFEHYIQIPNLILKSRKILGLGWVVNILYVINISYRIPNIITIRITIIIYLSFSEHHFGYLSFMK